MLFGLAAVAFPIFAGIHELAHVVVGVISGSEVVYFKWAGSLIAPLTPAIIMAGPIVEVLFVYFLGAIWVGFDTFYILFFTFAMHRGLDWEAAKAIGFESAEMLFLVFSAIMFVLSVRRVRNVRSFVPKR